MCESFYINTSPHEVLFNIIFMETTEFIWKNGEFLSWDKAQTHLLTHTLHYGAGVFEGIRCYKTEQGTAIFRLKEHVERLLYSAGVLKMEVPYSEDQLSEAIVETVRKNGLEQGYIRPLIYLDYGKMGLNPKGAPVSTMIACWPWGKYLAHDAVKVKISSYIRLHPRSTVSDAKICGHYVNSILPVLELRDTHYDEALLLDHEGNVAEGPGENIFIVKNGELYTPKPGNILPGITRDTVMTLARECGYVVHEEALPREALFEADEAFFTGTAAEVTPIGSIDDHGFGDGHPGPITTTLREAYMDVVYGRSSIHRDYLTFIS